MQCNIDARGKRVRLIGGVVSALIGVVLLFAWAAPSGAWAPWAVTIAIILCSAFAIFEARAGWCAIRAMGYKTPL